VTPVILRLIFLALLAATVAAFSLQNSAAVTVTVFVWKFHGPLAAALMGAFGAGFFLAALGFVPPLLSARFRERSLRKREDRPERPSDGPASPRS